MFLKYIGSAVLVFAVIGGGWYIVGNGAPSADDLPAVVDTGTNITVQPATGTDSENDRDEAGDDDTDAAPVATVPPGSVSGVCAIARDLSWGSKGNDVICLQKTLIAAGYTIPSGATGYFGPETTAAVSKWQKAVGITQSGYFGALSRTAFGGQPATNTSNPATPTATSFTLADVATHAARASCWSAINGIVYDLTTWIDKHPGGANRILSICGKDGSSAFDNQHAGEPRPEAMLATFKLGSLK